MAGHPLPSLAIDHLFKTRGGFAETTAKAAKNGFIKEKEDFGESNWNGPGGNEEELMALLPCYQNELT